MTTCVCKGNWRKIIEDVQPLLDGLAKHEPVPLVREDGSVWYFEGVLHGGDDYYYLLHDDEEYQLRSCVGSLGQHGFQPL